MRISDWSSDVCSSDLLQLQDLERLRRDLAALHETRQQLENDIAAMALARDRLQSQLPASEEVRQEHENKVVLLVGEVGKAETRIRPLTDLSEKAHARPAERPEGRADSASRVGRVH